MKERPIIFSGPMVTAILEGRKTQTRRVMNPQPDSDVLYWGWNSGDGYGFYSRKSGQPLACPYGAPGDLLWVREAFKPLPMDAPSIGPSQWMIQYAAGGHEVRTAPAGYNPMLYNYERFTPSIHMPRWASRLALRINYTEVRGVRAISEKDAIAEGVEPAGTSLGFYRSYTNDAALCSCAKGSFTSLWDSINGKRDGYTWNDNPWVWVVDFERVELQLNN